LVGTALDLAPQHNGCTCNTKITATTSRLDGLIQQKLAGNNTYRSTDHSLYRARLETDEATGLHTTC